MECNEFNAEQFVEEGATPKVIVEQFTEASTDTQFLELFAGEAGLTQAVERCGISVSGPGEIRTGTRVVVGMQCSTKLSKT